MGMGGDVGRFIPFMVGGGCWFSVLGGGADYSEIFPKKNSIQSVNSQNPNSTTTQLNLNFTWVSHENYLAQSFQISLLLVKNANKTFICVELVVAQMILINNNKASLKESQIIY